jgi:hypothetical protein
MGKYFAIYKGEALDFRFVKQNDDWCAFYIGHLLIGQIFKSKRSGGWSAVCLFAPEKKVPPIDGFISRFRAAEFLLKMSGIWS